MDWLKNKFKERGMGPKEVTTAYIAYNVFDSLTDFATLVICYKYKPLRKFAKGQTGSKLIKSLKTRYPDKYNKYTNFVIKKANKFAEWKYFKPIPKKLGLNSQNLSYSLIENIVFRELASPVTIPLQIWLTLQIYPKANK